MPVHRKRFPACPIERTLAVLSGRWKVMIVWHLLETPKRYSELEHLVTGIPQRVLTQALRELEEDGVVKKNDRHWVLTPLGMRLSKALQGVYEWGEMHAKELPDR